LSRRFAKELKDNREREVLRNERLPQGRKVPWFEGSDVIPDPDDDRNPTHKPSMKDIREALAMEAEKLKSGRIKWRPSWKTVEEVAKWVPRDGKRQYLDR
jgi:hypothetical protein